MADKFINYLRAKKSVDDRALNRHVLDVLRQQLPRSTPEAPLHVLEVAAGIGTMLQRLVEWEVLGDCIYTAVDLQPELIDAASRELNWWAVDHGFKVQAINSRELIIQAREHSIRIFLESNDVQAYLADMGPNRRWDLIIANAFLDLVDPASLLPDLFAVLKREGLYYFTINFDGETILLPELDQEMDQEIMRLYHHTMDTRGGGGSQTGRKLFQHIPAAGGEILGAGSSDWVVYPESDRYQGEEGYFLHCILDFFESSVQPLAPFDLKPWLKERRRQIDEAELIFIAHQLDFVGGLAP